MRKFFGYVRVSTVKQGEHGVSLQEQRDAIERYAARNMLEITRWFEEQETAAKRGRAIFSQMLRLLKLRQADGVIAHKIDRSARNLKDWADLGELIDGGVEVHFANESVNLSSRGGRLSADIQAVVAADFIRNLREETRKGFYGRLKQGIYPMRAPLGYLDQGGGNPKVPDPAKAALVRKAFELYASASYNLKGLKDEMYRLGLRNRNGNPVSLNGLSTILNNPFYIGLIRLRRSGETFEGIHEPLISKSLFDRVQGILNGRTNTRVQRHDFQFRRLLNCAECGYRLRGEDQKGRTYYRCHTQMCSGTCIREDGVDSTVRRVLAPLTLAPEEREYLKQRLPRAGEQTQTAQETELAALALRHSQMRDRLNRLTDAYIDRMIEKATFEERKTTLLMEQKEIEERQKELDSQQRWTERLAELVELAGSAHLQYEMGLHEEKRDLVKILGSNCRVIRKNVDFTLHPTFQLIADRQIFLQGTPNRDMGRTWDKILPRLVTLTLQTPVELLDRISEFLARKREGDPTHPSTRFHQAIDDNGNTPAPSL